MPAARMGAWSPEDGMAYDFAEDLYTAAEPVTNKFAQMAERRAGIANADIYDFLRRSRLEPPDTATFYHIATTLRRRGIERMRLRSVRLDQHTQAFFVIDGNEVIEVVSFRGLRQIRKLWEHSQRAPLGGGTPKERIEETYKFRAGACRVGGGLMNQNTGPRQPRKS